MTDEMGFRYCATLDCVTDQLPNQQLFTYFASEEFLICHLHMYEMRITVFLNRHILWAVDAESLVKHGGRAHRILIAETALVVDEIRSSLATPETIWQTLIPSFPKENVLLDYCPFMSGKRRLCWLSATQQTLSFIANSGHRAKFNRLKIENRLSRWLQICTDYQ